MRGVLADGESLRSIRIERGLTQEGLAALAELDIKTIRKAERGGRLDLSTLGRLGRALDAMTGRMTRTVVSEATIAASRRAVVERWLWAWDARDLESLLAVYHEGATLRLPGGPTIPFHGAFRGADQIRRAYETAWATCRTDPALPEDVLIHIMGKVLVLEDWRGVHVPSGEVARVWCVQIFAFDGDQVIDHRVVYDTLEFSRVLGFSAPAEDRESSR